MRQINLQAEANLSIKKSGSFLQRSVSILISQILLHRWVDITKGDKIRSSD